MPAAFIIGVGPGLGTSIARRFARADVPIGVIARSPGTVDATLSALADTFVDTYGVTADAADELALRAALDSLVDRLAFRTRWFTTRRSSSPTASVSLDTEGHLAAWATNVVGAITAAAHLLPRMARAGHGGSYILTGGMPVPVPQVTSLSLGKAGVRALAELLDSQFAPSGLHIATVTIGGAIAPGTAFDPDDIAEQYWRLHAQPVGVWNGRSSTAAGMSRSDDDAHSR